MNGVDQGVAFKNLPVDTPLYGAVMLFKRESKIVYNGLVDASQHGSSGPWQTSQQRKGNRISISDNIVTKTETSVGNGTAVVYDSVIIRTGSRVKKRWSFTIKTGDQHTIGVVTAAYNAARDEYVNKTTNGWGYYQGNGNKGHGGPANDAYGAEYTAGDVVDGL